MNKKIILSLIIIGYIALMIGSYFGASAIIEHKSKRFFAQSERALERYFSDGKKYVDLAFNSYRVYSTRIPIPSVQLATYDDALRRIRIMGDKETVDEAMAAINSKRLTQWEKQYGDISSLFELDIVPDVIENHYNSGWSLQVFEGLERRIDNGFYSYFLYPSQISFKKVGPFLEDSVPTIEEALQQALEFETQNTKSDLQEFYKKGCSRGLIGAVINAASNRYWEVTKDTSPKLWWNDSTISIESNTRPVDSGSMFNGFFEVSFKRTQPVTYSLKRVSESVFRNDRNLIRAFIWTLLTICLMGLLIFYRRKGLAPVRRQEESLFDQLTQVCSPQNFMDPYDKDRVEKSNSIYQRLIRISPDDTESLKEIRREAIRELGVSFISPERIEALKERCNPSNFMNPYQPDRVSLANRYYGKLSLGDLSIDDIEEIEAGIPLLYSKE